MACTDMYLDRKSGLLYLACVPPTIRKHWLPALQHLNATAVPALSPGYFATYDTRTGAVQRLTIEGGPEAGLQLHGFDIYTDEPDVQDKKKEDDDEEAGEPRKATLFAINHRVPRDGYLSAKTTGADSVIEVFETEIGSGTLRHQQTVLLEPFGTKRSRLSLRVDQRLLDLYAEQHGCNEPYQVLRLKR